jgi:restriction system protein
MTKSMPNEVDVAFELLVEEIEEVVNEYLEESEKALQARDFSSARKLMDRAELITVYRQKVDSVRREWGSLESIPLKSKPKPKPEGEGEGAGPRLQRGVRTSEDAYYRPILQSLLDLGGSGRTSTVLDLVGEKMGTILKQVDFAPLSSQPNEPRWKNTAKWARNSLVQDGRMSPDSPHGVWTITEKGRDWLRK